ncbi:MAG: macro domain-containing protein [Pirellulales bacterium]
MRLEINQSAIELHQGDITEEEVDAIVNAANPPEAGLSGGGGVDGAIHARGGPAIMAETGRRYPKGCPTGSAVITAAGNLAARYVIHAVGPVWRGGAFGEADLLASAYRRSFELARQHDCRSMALPALSAGAYGFPIDQASRIAVSTASPSFSSRAGRTWSASCCLPPAPLAPLPPRWTSCGKLLDHEGYLTTKLTMRPGTTMTLTIVLPAN